MQINLKSHNEFDIKYYYNRRDRYCKAFVNGLCDYKNLFIFGYKGDDFSLTDYISQTIFKGSDLANKVSHPKFDYNNNNYNRFLLYEMHKIASDIFDFQDYNNVVYFKWNNPEFRRTLLDTTWFDICIRCFYLKRVYDYHIINIMYVYEKYDLPIALLFQKYCNWFFNNNN